MYQIGVQNGRRKPTTLKRWRSLMRMPVTSLVNPFPAHAYLL